MANPAMTNDFRTNGALYPRAISLSATYPASVAINAMPPKLNIVYSPIEFSVNPCLSTKYAGIHVMQKFT